MLNSGVFKAIAHPVRRDILRRLRAGPMTAGDLAAAYTISKPSLSAHFKIMREAELITAERDGNRIHYALNLSVADELLAGVMELFGIEPAGPAGESASRPGAKGMKAGNVPER